MINVLIEDSAAVSGWLALQDERAGLKLHPDTFASSQMTHKRITASNVFVPGTFTVRSTPDNIEETVGVYVSDESIASRDRKVDYLIGLFTRVSFRLIKQSEHGSVMMVGQCADYTSNNQREYLHGGITLITFRVPVLPYKVEVER